MPRNWIDMPIERIPEWRLRRMGRKQPARRADRWVRTELGNLVPPIDQMPKRAWPHECVYRSASYTLAHAEVTGHWLFNKSGVPNGFVWNKWTLLSICDQCGARGNKRKIQHRFPPGPNAFFASDLPMDDYYGHQLCMACWNRKQPAWRRAQYMHELKPLINKLKGAISDAKKAKHDRPTSTTSS